MEIRGSWNLADAYWFVDQLGFEAVSDEGNGFVGLDSGSEPWWYPSLTNHRARHVAVMLDIDVGYYAEHAAHGLFFFVAADHQPEVIACYQLEVGSGQSTHSDQLDGSSPISWQRHLWGQRHSWTSLPYDVGSLHHQISWNWMT